jgi:hypothetical protein
MVAECVITISWGGRQVRTGLTVRNRYEIDPERFQRFLQTSTGREDNGGNLKTKEAWFMLLSRI